MSGADVSSIDDAHSCATGLHKRVKGQVIITLGEKGAVLSREHGTRHFPAVFCPDVVDTTGAGDSFIGGIAYCIVNGFSLTDAIPLLLKLALVQYRNMAGKTLFPCYRTFLMPLKTPAC